MQTAIFRWRVKLGWNASYRWLGRSYHRCSSCQQPSVSSRFWCAGTGRQSFDWIWCWKYRPYSDSSQKLSLANESLLIKPKKCLVSKTMSWLSLRQVVWVNPSMDLPRCRWAPLCRNQDMRLGLYCNNHPPPKKQLCRVENMIYQAGGVVKLITQFASKDTEMRVICSWWSIFATKLPLPCPRGVPWVGCACQGCYGSWNVMSAFHLKGTMSMVWNFVPTGAVSAGDVMIDEMPLVMLGMSFFATVRFCQRMGSLLWLSLLTVVRRCG